VSSSKAAADSAVRYLLESPCLAGRFDAQLAGREVDWPAVLTEAAALSSGQRVLVRVAHDLWTADGEVGMRELARSLDATHFERVVTALRLCRGERDAGSGITLRDVA
jgi:hypothetical protein